MTATGIKSFVAPEGGCLTAEMVEAFNSDGAVVLRDLVSESACQKLRDRTLKLVDEFDPGAVRSIFSAMEQTQLGDRYFEESGDKIRFFFEQDAFDIEGNLRQPKEDSLNKMGHAMHDLDPVFDSFSRTPNLASVSGSRLRTPRQKMAACILSLVDTKGR